MENPCNPRNLRRNSAMDAMTQLCDGCDALRSLRSPRFNCDGAMSQSCDERWIREIRCNPRSSVFNVMDAMPCATPAFPAISAVQLRWCDDSIMRWRDECDAPWNLCGSFVFFVFQNEADPAATAQLETKTAQSCNARWFSSLDGTARFLRSETPPFETAYNAPSED